MSERPPIPWSQFRREEAPAPWMATSRPATRDRDVEVDLACLAHSIHTRLLERYEPNELSSAPRSELLRLAGTELEACLAQEPRPIGRGLRDRVAEDVVRELQGLGPLQPLLDDPAVTEIMVNGPHQIWVERQGRLYPHSAVFADAAHLHRTIDRILAPLGRRVDELSPMVDARLADGSRVNAVIPPLALRGASLTIRKFSQRPLQITDLVRYGSLSAPMASFLSACVRGRLNILISGGTGSGKTTTLNVLSAFIPDDERIVTLEDAAELQLQQRHVVTLEARPANLEGKGEITLRALMRNALRMRPDRVVVGEVRGAEALDMLQAMNTGHDGSLGTLHSNGPRDSLARLELMVLMAGTELPLPVIRHQIASAVDLIVHQSRLRDGSRRITHISEVPDVEGGAWQPRDLFVWRQRGLDPNGKVLGEHTATGLRPACLDRLEAQGIVVDESLFAPTPAAQKEVSE